MLDHVRETQMFLARFREALTHLETCGELTLPHYREVWRLAGAEVPDEQLLSMWNSRDLLALGSADPDCLRSITRDSLTSGIAEFEKVLGAHDNRDDSSAVSDDTDDGVPLTDAEHHTRTGLEVIREMYRRGEYQQALARASIMPAGVRNHLGTDDPLYLKVLLSLAEFFDELGEYVQADGTARSVIGLLESQGRDQHPQYAQALLLLASVCRKTGNERLAEELLQQARRIWKDVLHSWDPAYARCLQLLADLLHERGERAQAGELFSEACRVIDDVCGQESAAYAGALTCQAEYLRRDEHWGESERLHRQALAIRRAIFHDEHPHCADSLHPLGLICAARGRFAEAHEHILKALSIRRRALGEWHPEYGRTLEDLASVKVALGRAEEALSLFHEALDIDDRTIDQAFALAAERQKLDYMAARTRRLHKYLSLVVDLGSDSLEGPRAFSFVLRRKGLVTEAVARQRDTILASRHPHHRDRLIEIARLRAYIARRSYAGPQEGESDADYRRVLEQLSERRDALEVELAREVSELDLVQQAASVDWRTIADLLPESSQLVEFLRMDRYNFTAIPAQGMTYWMPPIYLAFLVSPAGSLKWVNLGEAEPIDRLIADFRKVVTGESEHDSNRDMIKVKTLPALPEEAVSGHALRGAIFDRLVPEFSGQTRLLLAPDGDLAQLPFEILPTEEGRLFIDDYSISYVSCGRDILRFHAHSAGQPADALVAADPDFDLCCDGKSAHSLSDAATHFSSRELDQSNLSFDRLLATRAEGERIAQLLRVRPWLGGEVLEQRLKQVRSPWILHLATHGFFLSDQQREPDSSFWMASGDLGRFSGLRLENPLLRSGLALAGGNTWLRQGQLPPEAEDGLLTAEDVTGWDLLDTELVVLSACSTGLGEIRNGEGVFGLRRAFALAGAKTLVMSLWKVPDEETRELMENFYRRLLDGEPRAEALRSAQLALKAKYPHPFFWGAFICQGNPGPLPPRRRYGSSDGM